MNIPMMDYNIRGNKTNYIFIDGLYPVRLNDNKVSDKKLLSYFILI